MIQQEVKLGSGEDMKVLRGTYISRSASDIKMYGKNTNLFLPFQTDIKDQSFRVFLQNVRQVENAAFELNKKEGTFESTRVLESDTHHFAQFTAAAMQQAKSLLGQMGPLIQTDVPIQSNSTSTGALK